MTRVEAEVLNYLVVFIAENGYSPTVREICAHFGWSAPSTAHVRLQSLEAQGRITWNPRQSRTVRVVYQEVAS